jgi:rubrerythrin
MKSFRKLTEDLASKTDFTDDAQIARKAMEAELDAASFYEQMAAKTNNKLLKDVLLDVAREEKVHAAEFETVLETLDPEYEEAEEQGEKEVEKIKKSTKKKH